MLDFFESMRPTDQLRKMFAGCIKLTIGLRKVLFGRRVRVFLACGAVPTLLGMAAQAASPTITTQPSSSTLMVGSNRTLTVVASGTTSSGTSALSYQWYAGNAGIETSPVTGGTSASLVVSDGAVQTGTVSSYWVKVSNLDGGTNSSAATVAWVPSVYSSSSRSVLMPNTNAWPAGGVNLEGTQFINLGLQGVGRVPAKSIDSATGESLGSISDMQVESLVNKGNGVWSGTFSFLPDRGYNSGTIYSNYASRINRFSFTFTPYTGSSATTKQDQIAMQFLGSTRFTYQNGANTYYTTGLLATGTLSLLNQVVPVVSGTSTMADGSITNRLTIDAEGLALDNRSAKAGSGWVSDEYGPNIYHFDSTKKIDGVLGLPDAILPRVAGGTIKFDVDANNGTGSGRRTNQGVEGLAQSPDGTRLFGLMQSGLIQDSNPSSNDQKSTATRLLVYDISASDAPTAPVAQYVIELPNLDADGSLTNGATVGKTAAQSAVVAISNTQLLILSRDGNGRGSSKSPVFKSILLADLSKATNLSTSGVYDSATASVANQGALKAEITPMQWTQALNLISGLGSATSELAKFGMNTNAGPGDINTMSEKWEALGLVSVKDPAYPHDYFLFVGNDNDFGSATGKYLDSNNVLQSYDTGLENDTVVLAYRVRIQKTGSDSQALQIFAGTSAIGTPIKVGQAGAFSFGEVNSGSLTTQTYTIKNQGSASRTFAIDLQGTDKASFSILTSLNSGSLTVASGGTASISVSFKSFTEGTKTAALRIRDAAPTDLTATNVYEIPMSAMVGRSLVLESGTFASSGRYLLPMDNRWATKAIVTVGETVPLTGGTSGQTYAMAGIPDGLGAYDNGDGTMTVLVNHEIGSTSGTSRAHGAKGAFISEWIINKSDLRVVSAGDLIKRVFVWDSVASAFVQSANPIAFNRFCSADLPATTAFYNAATGLGTLARIFMNGEEGGANGYPLAHVASGANKGNSYVLSSLMLAGTSNVGAWENLIASPYAQDTTVVVATNDGGTGLMKDALAVYVGKKTSVGNEVQKAGLVGGSLKFVAIDGHSNAITNTTTRTTGIVNGSRFSLSATSTTQFPKLEDGAWNPINPREFYFVTSDQLDQVADNLGTQIGRTRLWRLTFDSIQSPELGGVIEVVVEGGVGNDANMWDNIAVTADGKLVLQEDTGNAAHNAKVWFYDPLTKVLTKVLQHDESKFGSPTKGATAPYSVDEESSGVIDITSMYAGNAKLGDRYFLMAVQAHSTDFTGIDGSTISGGTASLVERGQLLLARQLAVEKGVSTTATPYLLPTDPSFKTASVLTVGDQVPLTGGASGALYAMAGIPDGLGAYDNGDGTFTLLVNHELGSTSGGTRSHGAKGAFISEWIIRKSDLSVISGKDLIQRVYGWDKASQKSLGTTSTVAFNRFCSADLPAVSAFYNSTTKLGTQTRIFMSGEEGGSTGYAVGHVATGTDKGSSYVLGKFNLDTNGSGIAAVGGWENLLASPYEQDKTVVIGTNDGGTGIMSNSVAVYVGTKTNSGTEIDKAGLNNGTVSFISVVGNAAEIVDTTTQATAITNGTRFVLSSGTSTAFARPEDGAWNPLNPREFYFATTNRMNDAGLGLGSQIGRTRLWRLTFDDIRDPSLGGVIDLMVEGGVGNEATMWDNLTINSAGQIILQEDPGNTPHIAKVWLFDPQTKALTKILQHDPARFVGTSPTSASPFHQDEESSGVIEVTGLGVGAPSSGERTYLMAQQAHQANLDEFANVSVLNGGSASLVERGQIVLVRQLTSLSTTPVIEPDLKLTTTAGASSGASSSKTLELVVSNVGTGATDGITDVVLSFP